MKEDSRIILALDGLTPKTAFEKTQLLSNSVFGVKGNDLCDQIGREGINAYTDIRLTFLADLKLIDIPRTVARRVWVWSQAGASLITVMAAGGIKMMQEAVEAAGKETKILAVTVLTSLKTEESEILYGLSARAKVLQLATWAKIGGVYGIVCSPLEAKLLREFPHLNNLKIFTPGISAEWMPKPPGQERVDTAEAAIRNGVDMVIIGSAILNAPGMTPVEAAQKINEQIEKVLQEMKEKKE